MSLNPISAKGRFKKIHLKKYRNNNGTKKKGSGRHINRHLTINQYNKNIYINRESHRIKIPKRKMKNST